VPRGRGNLRDPASHGAGANDTNASRCRRRHAITFR